MHFKNEYVICTETMKLTPTQKKIIKFLEADPVNHLFCGQWGGQLVKITNKGTKITNKGTKNSEGKFRYETKIIGGNHYYQRRTTKPLEEAGLLVEDLESQYSGYLKWGMEVDKELAKKLNAEREKAERIERIRNQLSMYQLVKNTKLAEEETEQDESIKFCIYKPKTKK